MKIGYIVEYDLELNPRNELATKQLETYVENNNKINGLKEDQINLSRNRFWLYFGG